MKKFFTVAVFLLSNLSMAFCAPVTAQQALLRLQSSGFQKLRAFQDSKQLIQMKTLDNLYIFSDNKSFLILPNDDNAPALLAYSDSDPFDIENNPALLEWLEQYNKEVLLLQKNEKKPFEGNSLWRSAREEIKPLLSTKWNQEAPYNELCPKVDGRETVTGCVATAMAQVMKFYNYPEKGIGKHSYYWRPGEEELTFDYENTPFQWDLMTDDYNRESSEESRKAVATLMLGCGISVDMHYEPGGSGAATMQMGIALRDIFKYSKSIWMPNRVFYTYDEWEGMIYDELIQGRPVLYSGAGTAGGHQFVCDGYSHDGYFHFNWGWGGLSNGYFLLTALNPDDLGVGGGAGGFNSSQVASLGVKPGEDNDKSIYIMYNIKSFISDVEKVTAHENFRCSGLYFNYSLSNMPEGSRLGMKFLNEETGEVRYVEGPDVSGFHPNDGRNDLQIVFPELADATYIITPALHVEGHWSDVRMPVGYPSSVRATVKDLTATLVSGEMASVEITDIKIPDVIYIDHDFPMEFLVTNSGENEYYGNITPVLLTSEGKEIATSVFRPIDILPDDREKVNDYIGKFIGSDDVDIEPGLYKMIIKDDSGKATNTPVNVRIELLTETTKVKFDNFKLLTPNPIENPLEVKFSFNMECEAGLYFDSPRILIFPGDGGYELTGKTLERVYLTAGENYEFSTKLDLSRLEDGEYMAAVYTGDKAETYSVYFRIKRAYTIVEKNIVDYDYNSDVYDLAGKRCVSPLSPGIYILNGEKILIK